jgi:hypothetical protein
MAVSLTSMLLLLLLLLLLILFKRCRAAKEGYDDCPIRGRTVKSRADLEKEWDGTVATEKAVTDDCLHTPHENSINTRQKKVVDA